MRSIATIAVDIDDVCADLSTQWLKEYNYDFEDNLTKDKITDWAMHTFVKPECGMKIYNYIESKSMYDYIKPVKDSLEGINFLKESCRVIFITASTLGASGRKYTWLKDNGYIDSLSDYVEAKDKSLIRYNYLIDDNYANIKNSSCNFLFTQPWNKKFSYKQRINSWREFIDARKTA